MKNELLAKLQKEAESWRMRLDEARVQAKLGRMELRDKLVDFERDFERARADAGRKLSELRSTGGQEVDALARSVEAAWDGLVKTHREFSPLGKKQPEERS